MPPIPLDPGLASPNGDGPEFPTIVRAGSTVEFSPMKLLWQGDIARRILAGEDTFPVMVELTLTMACNLRCVWCVDVPWRAARPGTLKAEVIIERLAELREMGTKAITIEGGGEPTLHPEFQKIVQAASDMGFQLGLITHGGFIEKQAAVIPLFNWIRVSLDAYDAQIYEELKGVDNFEAAMRGLEVAVAARNESQHRWVSGEKPGHPVVGVGYLSSMGGTKLDKLDPLLERLRTIGVDYVQFRRIQTEEQITDPEGLDVGDVDLMGLKSKWETPEFHVYVHQMGDIQSGNAGLPCIAHRLSVQIGGSGEVWLCCRLRTQKNGYMGKVGSIYEQTMREIWASPEREAMVKLVADPKFTTKYCPECRLTKYNIALAAMKENEETSAFV